MEARHMTNEVKVQSGVGLGMKIAFGFVLFFLVVMGGTCVACGACATMVSASSQKARLDREKAARLDAGTVAPSKR
jgi:hypothetical protein